MSDKDNKEQDAKKAFHAIKDGVKDLSSIAVKHASNAVKDLTAEVKNINSIKNATIEDGKELPKKELLKNFWSNITKKQKYLISIALVLLLILLYSGFTKVFKSNNARPYSSVSSISKPAGKSYTIVFACMDPYAAGRDKGLAEVLLRHIADGCSQCYANLITSSSVAQICRDSGAPLTNEALLQNAEKISSQNGVDYLLIKSNERATLGVIGR